MLNFDENKINNILSNISIPAQLGTDHGNDSSYEVEGLSDTLFGECNVTGVYWGVTKMAIVPTADSEVVIKIPFSGQWLTEDYYNEEDDEWKCYDEPEWYYFERANDMNMDDTKCWDYCGNELDKYELAVREGFGEFFPETKFYKMHDNYPIYIQERCTPWYGDNAESYKSCSEASKDTYNKNSKELRCGITPAWIMCAIDAYGLERVSAFITFVKDNGIRDLHTGNIGFNKAGKPIILDFAGYRDNING